MSAYGDQALAFFAARAIDPGVASELGVIQQGDELIFPGDRRRDLNGDGRAKVRQAKGQKLAAWWAKGRPSDASLVLATEGESDCLAALSWLPATPSSAGLRELPVVSIPGTGFPVGRLVEELRQVGASEVVLALDADEAGRGYVDRAAAALREQGIRPVALELPDGLDLAEWLAAMPEDKRGELFASALVDAEAVDHWLEDPREMGASDVVDVSVSIVTLDEFVDVEEPGAEPVLGAPGEAVIPEDGDAMLYGDGGASKTTLAVDLALHLAAGDNWLGIEVPKPVRVLLIEAEGPRPLFRQKLRAKRDSWQGSEVGDRVRVYEKPWANFRFPDADEVATLVGRLEIDVLVVGPLTRVGMEELGTLQQVRDFMAEVGKFRERSGRSLTVILIHHENKGGTVSGAWEGAGDTLMHATVHARGKTVLHFQKTRWSSSWHKQTLELDWIDGEGFEVTEDPDRDLVVEVRDWLLAEPYSTYREIATKKEIKRKDGTIEKTIPGIGANWTEVRDVLIDRQDLFRERTGEAAKAVGRHPSSHVWEVKDGGPEGVPDTPAHPGTPVPPGGGGGQGVLGVPALRAHQHSGTPPPTSEGVPAAPGTPGTPRQLEAP